MRDTIITDEDVIWNMNWKETDKEMFGKSEPEEDFEDSIALARLLAEEVVFINSYWWRKDWKEEDREIISIGVKCNDIFACCADAEELPHGEIENLYKMWIKDPAWGTAVWCIKKRNKLPQKPVYDYIQKAGIWDLDSMKLELNS